jgi:hypothetical protein
MVHRTEQEEFWSEAIGTDYSHPRAGTFCSQSILRFLCLGTSVTDSLQATANLAVGMPQSAKDRVGLP